MSASPLAEVLKEWGNRLVEAERLDVLVARLMMFLGLADVLKHHLEYLPEGTRRALEETYAIIEEVMRENTYLAELAKTDKAKLARAAGRIAAAGAIAAMRFAVASGQRALAREF